MINVTKLKLMIKIFMQKFSLFFILYLISATSIARNLDVGWELWFPYQYRNKAQELVGLDFEIFNSVINKANFTASFVELPWKRHLRYIKSGDMDVAFGASYTEERNSYAYFTDAYRTETVKLFVVKNKRLKLNKLEDLMTSHYLIGIETGYYYGKKFHQLMNSKKFSQHINEVIDIEQNISMLLKGRIDGLLADPNTIKAFSQKFKIEGELALQPLEIYQADIYFMLSRKSLKRSTLEKFNQAIKDIKNDGTLNKILRSYGYKRD